METASVEQPVHRKDDDRSLPPRQRILIAARELFYKHGIHGIGVDAIAEAAGTNKMTLYRHFESKDLLVAEYLRGLAAEGAGIWKEIDEAHPGDPLAQIHAWLTIIGEHETRRDDGGCALVNAAIQISDPEHPGRKVIEQSKRDHRNKLVALCCASNLSDPELLADQLFLLVEGSRVSYRSVGPNGPSTDLKVLAAGIIAAHKR